MSTAEKYLQNATTCILLAGKLSGADQVALARVAQDWRELAERTMKPKADDRDPLANETRPLRIIPFSVDP